VTAEVLTANPRAVIKIGCAKFQHSHEIAKLIGSHPGYPGHRETHRYPARKLLISTIPRPSRQLYPFDEIGASEMSDLMVPKPGFYARKQEAAEELDQKLTSKMTQVTMQAERRKFTPEFIDRIDKIAVVRPWSSRVSKYCEPGSVCVLLSRQ
jgi:hypothetical protein